MSGLRRFLVPLDRKVYQVERVAAATLFLLMALVMFTSVLQRIYSRPEGRLSAAVLSLLRAAGANPDPAFIHGPVSTGLNLVITFALAFAALRTMKLSRPLSAGRALGLAAAVTLGLGLFLKALLWLFPNGLVWGSVVSLSCMLWVGFLGGSMATFEKRHLALEMGEKLWPKKLLPYVTSVGRLITAGLCVFLLALSFLSLKDHYQGWLVNHLAGNLMPTEIPKWAVFIIFPYTFVVMSLRLLGGAVAAVTTEPAAAAAAAAAETEVQS